jgi:hypothetical protein
MSWSTPRVVADDDQGAWEDSVDEEGGEEDEEGEGANDGEVAPTPKKVNLSETMSPRYSEVGPALRWELSSPVPLPHY